MNKVKLKKKEVNLKFSIILIKIKGFIQLYCRLVIYYFSKRILIDQKTNLELFNR